MGNSICKWCFFEMKYHTRGGLHCKKMLKRLRSKIRIGNKCKRCGHDKKIHNGQQFEIKNRRSIMILRTMCSHLKLGKGMEPNLEDFLCNCRGYL